jgi:hypothetical protein
MRRPLRELGTGLLYMAFCMQTKDVLVSRTGAGNPGDDSMPNMKLATGVGVSALALTVAIAGVDALEQAQTTPVAAAVPYYEPAPDSGPKVPDGFTPIFNGQDLSGWHVSKTNHHGTTPEYRVVNGIIVGTQNPSGKGGILLTDKKYKNFEVYMEIKPDWGCDSGLFLRSNEKGDAYQVTLDYLPGGSMGGIYGEGLKGVQGGGRVRPWQEVWKRENWNTVRARIEGDVPHIMVWINDQLVTDWTDTANHAADGAADGMIAIQMHFSDNEKVRRWADGGFWRWRVIAVKELPAK